MTGSCFCLEMEDEVFILSNVIADIHRFENGNIIGFNGTTEWALDSVEQDDVVWLPREEQARDLLGAAFVRLEQDRWVCGDRHRRERRGPPVRRHRGRTRLRPRRWPASRSLRTECSGLIPRLRDCPGGPAGWRPAGSRSP